tara:strand:- start:1765 stop:2265 length:501 start_codon:yes stop_codon:yes gene_type:complete
MSKKMIILFALISLFLTGLTTKEKVLYYKDKQYWLSYAIYFEARSESTAGMIGVGQVVLNRVRSPKWPATIKGVVTQGVYKGNIPVRDKCNFSFWCDGIPEKIANKKAWNKVNEISKILLYKKMVDITDGADHYELKSNRPWWSKGMKRTAVIDSHIFYKSKWKKI